MYELDFDRIKGMSDRAWIDGTNVSLDPRDVDDMLKHIARLERATVRLATVDGVDYVDKRLAAMKD